MTINRLLILKLSDFGKNGSLNIITIFCFIIMMLGCSRAIYSVYMPDDYLLASTKMPMAFYLNQGRFIQALITGFFNFSNVNIISSSPIFTPLFLLTTSFASAYIIINLLPKNSSLLLSLLITGVIVSHPVYSMMAVYHLAVVCFTICMICVSFYVFYYCDFLSTARKRDGLFSALFIVLICGNYQPAFIIVLIFSVVKVYTSQVTLFSVAFFKRLWPIFCGLLIYVIIFKLTKESLGVNHWDSRGGLVDDLSQRYSELINFIPSLLYKNWWVIPQEFSAILLFSFSLFFFSFIYENKTLSFSMFTIFFGIFLLPLLPIAILKVWDPTPRALFSISFFYSISCAIFYNESFKKLKILALVLTIFMGLISSNHYLYLTEMNQKKDIAVVNAAYSLLKQHVLSDKSLVIVNNDAINIDSWALRGFYFFQTNERLNITMPSILEKKMCESGKGKMHVIENKDKLIVCLY